MKQSEIMLCFCLTQLTGQDLGSVQAEVVHEVCHWKSLRLRTGPHSAAGQDGDSPAGQAALSLILDVKSNVAKSLKMFFFRSVYLCQDTGRVYHDLELLVTEHKTQ